MKKVLLSLSMLAAVMTAGAQVVGVGVYDDFNQTDQYGTATGGIYWWTPTTPASAAGYYTLNRNVASSGVLEVAVAKTATSTSTDPEKFAPFGFGFGDTNGDGSGTPYTINVSANPKMSFKVKASTGTPDIKIKLKDVNNNEIEVKSSGTSSDWWQTGQQFYATASTTYQTVNFDFTGSKGVRCYDAGNPNNAVPACTGFEFSSSFDFTQVKEVDIFVATTDAGGFSYTGTITFDDFKFGSTPAVGLGTKSAAANIASTKVFPNPATSEFTAEVNLMTAASTTVILSDMMGKQISTQSVDANGQASFKTAGLANGIYTVTYVVDGTPAKTELVVVK